MTFFLLHPPLVPLQPQQPLCCPLNPAQHASTSGPLHWWGFFSCLDLAFSRSLCDSLSHFLSSLSQCFLWDVPYTLFITLAPTISLATFILLISDLSLETPNSSFIYTVYSLPLHTPLEYNFHKDRTFLNSFLFSVCFCLIIALSSQCREKTGTYRVSLNVGWMNGMQGRRN